MNLSWPRMSNNNVNSGASGSRSDGQAIFNSGSIEVEQTTPINYKKQKKTPRYRYAYTTDQIIYLENVFKRGRYVTTIQRQEIAQKIGVSDRVVKVWFQNRRMKEKQALKEQADEEDFRARSFTYPPGIPRPISSDRSLPIVSPPRPMLPPNIVSNQKSNPGISKEPTIICTPSPFRPNYYEDISPERDATSAVSVYISSPTKSDSHKNSSEYKASAEFSIDLCKKYKNILTRYKSEGNIIPNNTTFSAQPPSPFDLRMNIEKPELQDEPQDLSMKKSDSTECHESIRKSPTFVNIPQPTVPDGPIWEELTLPPVAHNNMPAASISILPAPPSSKSDDNVVPMRSCDCCKCPKQSLPSLNSLNEEPQYIINVVPYQNYKK